MVALKNYQIKTLDTLKAYLETARFKGARPAYDEATNRPYKPMEGLPTVPFVCLRLPTGGGKTLLSAHSVRVAAETYLETEFPVVLWMVPTDTIKTQTLETLKNPANANYQALRDAFDGRFSVFDLEDFRQITPSDIRTRAVVVVGTIQTLRVDDTEERKVYQHNEFLEPHFTAVSANTPGLELKDDGTVKFSFRNLLAFHRPLVIVDEAHKATTGLSYKVWQRVNAACIIEFTATPQNSSNILYRVSASELKAEDMIKLPIRLTPRNTWEEAVEDSIRTRKELEEQAKDDPQYIRPIVLFQAEKKNQDITKQVLLEHLTNPNGLNIPRDKIAVVTGDDRELDGVNLFDPACKIDYVITVEALKEGWDCSFAYVFCSVATVNSARDVEQILGRVLRMPYATRRKNPNLNCAYAFVSKTSWPHAVEKLHDKLVDMGFEAAEVAQNIEEVPPLFAAQPLTASYAPAPAPMVFELSEPVDANAFAGIADIKLEQGAAGPVLTITKPLSEDDIAKVEKALPASERKALKTEHAVLKAQWDKHLSPSQRGEVFRVPQLCVWQDGELQLAEKEIFLDAKGWDLLDAQAYPPSLSETEFNLSEDGQQFEIDITAEGRLTERFAGQTNQLNLSLTDLGWDELRLSRFLDSRLRQPDIGQTVLLEFCRRVVNYLVTTRHIPVTALVRGRYILIKKLLDKLKAYRNKAYNLGYQQTFFAPTAKVEASFNYDFAFRKDTYTDRKPYVGSWKFNKHFFPLIAEMESSGEEFECAKAIDALPQVKHWVRNPAQQECSFWLPTSSDKFYPDFVAELTDGRILVVEYKGALHDKDDVAEKTNIGQLWEANSGEKCLFLMAFAQDGQGRIPYQQIENKVGKA